MFVAIGYNRVCFFNFFSFLARIEREFEFVRLCASELEIIANAGNAFFGRNIKENERMLSIYLERLDFVIEQERKDQREKQRVAGAVSGIGGMMLVILFL